jgi:ABC-type antimicrobial peptide transport system, ATPase component
MIDQPDIALQPLPLLIAKYPCIRDFVQQIGLPVQGKNLSLSEWINQLNPEQLQEAGYHQNALLTYLQEMIVQYQKIDTVTNQQITSLTILGGTTKQGIPEEKQICVRPGEIITIVGPTGSGKSRLLADIECLAQCDTPSGRSILINGMLPDRKMRFSSQHKLVAQLSQNMNFVVDLTVQEFITMHATCRHIRDIEQTVARVIACANDLTGEKFLPSTPVTQLSGGQTRALMIADIALLGSAPIILIDEIENAGVDRQRALELLVSEDKIVFISTHDPLLALRGNSRIVIQNGGIHKIIPVSEEEKHVLDKLESLESVLLNARDTLRAGNQLTRFG